MVQSQPYLYNLHGMFTCPSQHKDMSKKTQQPNIIQNQDLTILESW
jgi:hypothetical protein